MNLRYSIFTRKAEIPIERFSVADLKAVRGVYWSDFSNIQCYIPNENVECLFLKVVDDASDSEF